MLFELFGGANRRQHDLHDRPFFNLYPELLHLLQWYPCGYLQGRLGCAGAAGCVGLGSCPVGFEELGLAGRAGLGGGEVGAGADCELCTRWASSFSTSS